MEPQKYRAPDLKACETVLGGEEVVGRLEAVEKMRLCRAFETVALEEGWHVYWDVVLLRSRRVILLVAVMMSILLVVGNVLHETYC